mmetsp:Transcript_83814/g.254364  ORF Transcript_83814/g.254364 Transcript_83814/m.254364 type:complete len:713 (-) Transcript_83814:123-2261(-)
MTAVATAEAAEVSLICKNQSPDWADKETMKQLLFAVRQRAAKVRTTAPAGSGAAHNAGRCLEVQGPAASVESGCVGSFPAAATASEAASSQPHRVGMRIGELTLSRYALPASEAPFALHPPAPAVAAGVPASASGHTPATHSPAFGKHVTSSRAPLVHIRAPPAPASEAEAPNVRSSTIVETMSAAVSQPASVQEAVARRARMLLRAEMHRASDNHALGGNDSLAPSAPNTSLSKTCSSSPEAMLKLLAGSCTFSAGGRKADAVHRPSASLELCAPSATILAQAEEAPPSEGATSAHDSRPKRGDASSRESVLEAARADARTSSGATPHVPCAEGSGGGSGSSTAEVPRSSCALACDRALANGAAPRGSITERAKMLLRAQMHRVSIGTEASSVEERPVASGSRCPSVVGCFAADGVDSTSGSCSGLAPEVLPITAAFNDAGADLAEVVSPKDATLRASERKFDREVSLTASSAFAFPSSIRPKITSATATSVPTIVTPSAAFRQPVDTDISPTGDTVAPPPPSWRHWQDKSSPGLRCARASAAAKGQSAGASEKESRAGMGAGPEAAGGLARTKQSGRASAGSRLPLARAAAAPALSPIARRARDLLKAGMRRVADSTGEPRGAGLRPPSRLGAPLPVGSSSGIAGVTLGAGTLSGAYDGSPLTSTVTALGSKPAVLRVKELAISKPSAPAPAQALDAAAAAKALAMDRDA